MKTPREKAAAETWTDGQITCFALVATIMLLTGIAAGMAIVEPIDYFTQNIVVPLICIGSGMASRNLAAKYGISPYRPSLGGAFPWVWSSMIICLNLNLGDFLSSVISTFVLFPFMLHFSSTKKQK